MRDPHAVFAEALALPEDQRADLARQLSESLELDTWHGDAKEELARTVARRVQEVREGTAVTVTADEAFARAHQRLAARRGH